SAFACALRSGTVLCWGCGSNFNGTPPVEIARDAVSLSMTEEPCWLDRRSGHVLCSMLRASHWEGLGSDDRLVVEFPLQNVDQFLSAGITRLAIAGGNLYALHVDPPSVNGPAPEDARQFFPTPRIVPMGAIGPSSRLAPIASTACLVDETIRCADAPHLLV